MQACRFKHLLACFYKILLLTPEFLVTTGYLKTTLIYDYKLEYSIFNYYNLPLSMLFKYQISNSFNIPSYTMHQFINKQTVNMSNNPSKFACAQTQTDEFLQFLAHEDKLIRLYERIKAAQIQKRELTEKIQYLSFKNKALQKSLFESELKYRERQSHKNQSLLHDVINLEEELVKCKSQINTPNSREKAQAKNLIDFGNRTKLKNQNIKLGIISQLPEIVYSETASTLQLLKTNPAPLVQPVCCQKNKKSQVQMLTQKINKLSKQLQKQDKTKKLIDLQNKRLRKMNQEYSIKCRRLEKLVDAKNELYSNFSTQLNFNSNNTVCNNGSELFEAINEDSLFQ